MITYAADVARIRLRSDQICPSSDFGGVLASWRSCGGAACLLLPALINGFPFVFPDSVDYLVFTPHIYRSPFYGLFIFFFHLDRFIWAPVFAQALIASHLLWVFVRIYAGEPKLRWFALIVLMLGLFSSLPFFTGFIMPDFFTSVMILVFYLLGFHAAALGRGEKIYFVLLACVAISAHISHLPQAIALGASRPPASDLPWSSRSDTRLRQTAILLVPLALAASATLLNNLLIHRVFALVSRRPDFRAREHDRAGSRQALSSGGLPGRRIQALRQLEHASGKFLRIPLVHGQFAAARWLRGNA